MIPLSTPEETIRLQQNKSEIDIITRQKKYFEEQLEKINLTECAAGKFAVNIQRVSTVSDGNLYHEYSPGKFALNVYIVSKKTC